MSNPLTMTGVILLVIFSSLIGILWALWNFLEIKKIKVQAQFSPKKQYNRQGVSEEQRILLLDIGSKISNGAYEFLKQEYLVCIAFVVIMFFIILGAVEQFKSAYISFAFVIGAFTSIACGTIGMMIATYTNYRVTYQAQRQLASAFKIAYRGGCVMGFSLVSLGLLILMLLILVYQAMMGLGNTAKAQNDYYSQLFEAIAGYGFGGSTVALFGRVGGGIYTKAADVGADLVGKVQHQLGEDSPKNPATIADNVGDNVGDIAGMGSDLFGSLAQSTCAALLISSTNLFQSSNGIIANVIQLQNLMFPLVLISFGILISIITSFIGIYCTDVNQFKEIQNTLKYQIFISTFLLLGFLYLAAFISFPTTFVLKQIGSNTVQVWAPYVCSILGLISGMIIGLFTQYMTSHSYTPVQQLANSCRTGAAINVIFGISLGYLSTVIPVICIALTAYGSHTLLGYYGISLAALGMLANLPIALAMDGYGPISDNAGGIAQMSLMGEQVRSRTDALDAAGNTTAAIGKGFAIGSAALVSLSLYGGFLYNSKLDVIGSDLVTFKEPLVFVGLLIGGMLPFVFSAFTIKSVGKAALGMVDQIRRQIRQKPGILTGEDEPDYNECIKISAQASLIQMIAPGCLVIFTPLLLGIAFGPKILAGFLPGALVSGVQIAISASNTGGAWDNAKKYIQAGNMSDNGIIILKGSEVHKAAVVGDTIGDPLKDTSGPSINILIKLMAILSLIFARLFLKIHPQ